MVSDVIIVYSINKVLFLLWQKVLICHKFQNLNTVIVYI